MPRAGGYFIRPDAEHRLAEITAKHRAQFRKNQRKIRCPAAHVQHLWAGNGNPLPYLPEKGIPPAAIDICGEDVVEKIVPARDSPAHIANFARFIADLSF